MRVLVVHTTPDVFEAQRLPTGPRHVYQIALLIKLGCSNINDGLTTKVCRFGWGGRLTDARGVTCIESYPVGI